jgi:hypothetical protein
MTKKISLIFPKSSYHIYHGITLPREMGVSELLKIIGATELVECDINSAHIDARGSFRDSGELENKNEYLVHTNNLKNTLNFIQKYRQKAN